MECLHNKESSYGDHLCSYEQSCRVLDILKLFRSKVQLEAVVRESIRHASVGKHRHHSFLK